MSSWFILIYPPEKFTETCAHGYPKPQISQKRKRIKEGHPSPSRTLPSSPSFGNVDLLVPNSSDDGSMNAAMAVAALASNKSLVEVEAPLCLLPAVGRVDSQKCTLLEQRKRPPQQG
jgi:hypothetical protein